MSVTTTAVIVILVWVILMAGFWCVSWTNAVAAVFVVGVIALGVAVSWQRVEQYHAQDDATVAAAVASYDSPMIAPAPPPDYPRAGT